MSTGFIAYHYPEPEHFADFVEGTKIVRDTFGSQPGCRTAKIWATTDNDAVITSATFDTERQYQDAFAVVQGLGGTIDFDAFERKPREILAVEGID